MSSAEDYYQILNVSQHANKFDIKRSYRKLASLWHPEHVALEKKEEAEKVFKKIVEAYYVLGHSESRKMYDDQRNAQQIVIQSEVWSFVDSGQSSYHPDSLNYYYREQRAHCDAFRLDWRDFLGGTVAKIWAGAWFLLFFMLGQNTFSFLSIDLFGTTLFLPIAVVTLYIIFESLRDFVWELVVDDEMYDIGALAACWLMLIGLTVFVCVKP